jgi:DinB superfamily
MQVIVKELGTAINNFLPALHNIPENEFAFKTSPEKWSKKEIIGHLIDSAQNNIRRFIVAQYEQSPSIVYNQDKWVLAGAYQEWNNTELINLWYLLNKHIIHILQNMPEEMAQRTCQTQDLHTLEWLAKDYIKHLLHHLHVVLNLEPIAYP